jgi:putative restriction endonuclease
LIHEVVANVMSKTSFFQRVGAPLRNARWSWGAQRASDGAVFLCVWQDLKFIEDGRIHMLIERPAAAGDYEANPGHAERKRHIASIRAGAPCFLVMCTVADASARPRKIQFFNEDELFVGGALVERNGDTWIQVAGRRPVADVART